MRLFIKDVHVMQIRSSINMHDLGSNLTPGPTQGLGTSIPFLMHFTWTEED